MTPAGSIAIGPDDPAGGELLLFASGEDGNDPGMFSKKISKEKLKTIGPSNWTNQI